MMRLPRIKTARPGGRPLTLDVVLSNRRRLTVDLGAWIGDFPPLQPLRDPAVFATVRVMTWGHALAWGEMLDEDGSGPIDISVDQIVRMAGEQAGDIMPAAAFRAWRERCGLSLTAAAAALGLSRRMATYYDNGTWPVPKTVMLACEGWEARQAKRAA
jgi:hypothetical protein